MTTKAVMFAFLLVLMMVLLVYMVEFFLPLSVKSDMNIYCRNTLLKMEIQGGLMVEMKDELDSNLEARSLSNITISGTAGAKQGEEISIRVEADYVYNKLTGLFSRSAVVQHMVYSKTSISRKVTN
jgi:hypothetical protein